MLTVLQLIGTFFVDLLFQSQRQLKIEDLFLRHQLNIAVRRAAHRFQSSRSDRALLVWMPRLMPNLLDLAEIVRLETILRWHRAGFRAYWRWKSRGRPGRPKINRELRDFIRKMSKENLPGADLHVAPWMVVGAKFDSWLAGSYFTYSGTGTIRLTW